MPSEQFQKAISEFDDYNSNDPHMETGNDGSFPKELLYARRMSERLESYTPEAPEYLKLAARCQHIGRWEISRDEYPMNKKGYLQWRNTLKEHHAKLAQEILKRCLFDSETIDKVKLLLLKKELRSDADTQVLEDIICLVFVEFYLADFAAKHEPEKVVDILRKTMRKMSSRAIDTVGTLSLSDSIHTYIQQAAAG